MKNEKFLERILIVLSYMIFILVIGLLARFMNEVINIASKLQDKHSTFSFMSYLIAMLQVAGIKGLIRCDFLKIEPLVIKLMKNNKFLLVQNISSPRSVLNDKEVINFDKYLY
ncbi:hypothetical protein F975_00302 [Acinetobacter sp. ANC 3789]|uniref:hypothetical protein n=1 Tax=Acinetobacter sp. ANC 3789 TaxID=1217714 RepID=UPI0002CE6770|nr:hypothetical protein [Acinetobacter sp. ANC 3789]ENU81692.1 hypothetical protein F975_00302 [Acinetobacter sp. ANC 3789]